MPEQVLKDRYRILRPIGQGGMGSVYQAEDLRLKERLTAIKAIRLAAELSPEQEKEERRLFLREASTLARLDHPSLPKVSDFFSIDDHDFLVMDYVPGVDLRVIIEQQVSKGTFIPEETLLNWAGQIAEALHYLHTQTPPILHRDIKPANIKITPDNRVKLVDFGLVTLLHDEDSEASRTMTIVQGRGSLHYTPLEQYGENSGQVSPRSDIYAFGATLYHLATHKLPPEAKKRFLEPAILQDPRNYNPLLSRRLCQGILWAMSMHPDDRPNSVQQLRDALLEQADMPHMVVPGLRSTELQVDMGMLDPDMAKGNVALAALAVALFIAAIFVTFFSPTI